MKQYVAAMWQHRRDTLRTRPGSALFVFLIMNWRKIQPLQPPLPHSTLAMQHIRGPCRCSRPTILPQTVAARDGRGASGNAPGQQQQRRARARCRAAGPELEQLAAVGGIGAGGLFLALWNVERQAKAGVEQDRQAVQVRSPSWRYACCWRRCSDELTLIMICCHLQLHAMQDQLKAMQAELAALQQQLRDEQQARRSAVSRPAAARMLAQPQAQVHAQQQTITLAPPGRRARRQRAGSRALTTRRQSCSRCDAAADVVVRTSGACRDAHSLALLLHAHWQMERALEMKVRPGAGMRSCAAVRMPCKCHTHDAAAVPVVGAGRTIGGVHEHCAPPDQRPRGNRQGAAENVTRPHFAHCIFCGCARLQGRRAFCVPRPCFAI